MSNYPYRAAGTFDGASYVEREADVQLLKEIERNQRYPYVLAPRQSGKSSLIIHVSNTLDATQYKTIFVDLSTFPKSSLLDYDAFLDTFIQECSEAVSLVADGNQGDLRRIIAAILSRYSQRVIIFI